MKLTTTGYWKAQMISVNTLFLTRSLADYLKSCSSDKTKNMYMSDVLD